jgi:hypothetical protein
LIRKHSKISTPAAEPPWHLLSPGVDIGMQNWTGEHRMGECMGEDLVGAVCVETLQ